MGGLAELPQAAHQAQTAARHSSLGDRAPALLPIVNHPSSALASGSAARRCVCRSQGGRAVTKHAERSAGRMQTQGFPGWPAHESNRFQLHIHPQTLSSPSLEARGKSNQPHLLDNHNCYPRTISNHFCPEECCARLQKA